MAITNPNILATDNNDDDDDDNGDDDDDNGDDDDDDDNECINRRVVYLCLNTELHYDIYQVVS
jgi:hypothetical protein